MISLERTRGDRQGDPCLSDLRLDQLRVGELSGEARDRSRAHIETCARCRDRQRALEEQVAASLAALPPLPASPPLSPAQETPAASVGPPGGPRRRWIGAGAAGLGLAAAALLLVIVQPSDPEELSPSQGAAPKLAPTTRTKGAPTLHFHVRRDGRVFEGGPGDLIRPGDALRFAYSWPEGGELAVLSRDGAGTVSAYFPAGERTFTAAPGEKIDLPGAVLLDDVVGDEVLYGVFCAEATPLSVIERAVDARPEDPELAGCVVDRIRVDKRARP